LGIERRRNGNKGGFLYASFDLLTSLSVQTLQSVVRVADEPVQATGIDANKRAQSRPRDTSEVQLRLIIDVVVLTCKCEGITL
jgi:hypothetical protein